MLLYFLAWQHRLLGPDTTVLHMPDVFHRVQMSRCADILSGLLRFFCVGVRSVPSHILMCSCVYVPSVPTGVYRDTCVSFVLVHTCHTNVATFIFHSYKHVCVTIRACAICTDVRVPHALWRVVSACHLNSSAQTSGKDQVYDSYAVLLQIAEGSGRGFLRYSVLFFVLFGILNRFVSLAAFWLLILLCISNALSVLFPL